MRNNLPFFFVQISIQTNERTTEDLVDEILFNETPFQIYIYFFYSSNQSSITQSTAGWLAGPVALQIYMYARLVNTYFRALHQFTAHVQCFHLTKIKIIYISIYIFFLYLICIETEKDLIKEIIICYKILFLSFSTNPRPRCSLCALCGYPRFTTNSLAARRDRSQIIRMIMILPVTHAPGREYAIYMVR